MESVACGTVHGRHMLQRGAGTLACNAYFRLQPGQPFAGHLPGMRASSV